MNIYELTLVLSGKASNAKKKSVSEKVEKMVEALGGKIRKSDEWGKIDFAYKMGKESSGLYLYYDLELDKSGAKKMRNKLRIESDIMRYLLIRT